LRNSFKTALASGTALGVLLSVATVTPSLAQDVGGDAAAVEATEEQPVADPSTEVEAVVVVGSRIRRDTYNTPAPITVITREEATLQGFASTTEALQSTAVTGGSSQINNAYGGYVTEGGPGANTIGLRGLGPSRTLVLLNGRRVAPAGSRGSVGTADLNVLPTAMLERVEILRDGASSIYGSDAIGGVVNLVTRKNVEGFEIEAQYNAPLDGGGESSRIAIVGGHEFNDRFRMSGSVEWDNRRALTLGDRDWTRCNQDYTFDDNGDRSDYIDPTTGRYKCYPITATGSNGVTINTIGTGLRQGVGAPTVGVGLPGGNGDCDTSVRGQQAGPDNLYCFNRWRYNPGVAGLPSGALNGWEGVGGGSVLTAVRDTFERRMLNEDLISPTERVTAFLQGSFDTGVLGNGVAYFELLGNQRKSSQTGYRQLSLDYAVGSPLIPGDLQFSVLSGPSDITNGENVGVRAFIGFGNDQSEQEVTFLKFTTGLRGDFVLPDWKYDFTVSHSRSDAEYMMEAFLIDRLSQSLDVVAAPGGGFACRDGSAGCVAAPALTPDVVAGVLPADWVDYVWRPVTGSTKYDETVVSAVVDGPLYELPAGAVQGVFGVEYRTAEIDDTPSIHSQTGNLLNLTTSAPTRGSDSVWEAFGEVEIPVLRDMALANDLTISASARYTDYESYGDDWTYKLGAVYSPVQGLTFRATYGTSFRAPALFEQFQGATSGFLSATSDPCSADRIGPEDGIRAQNCALEGIGQGYQPTSGITVVSAGGAAQGLEAETSSNFTAGVILTPELPEGWGKLAVAVDYYEIEIENGVQRVGAGSLIQQCYDDPDFRAGGGYCRFISERDPTTNALTVYDSYANVATQIVEGVDYNVRYTRDVGPGDLRLNLSVTQYLEQSTQLFPTDPVDDYNGTLTAPEFTGTFVAAYTLSDWTFQYGVDWVGEQDSHAYLGIGSGRTSGYDFAVDDYFLHNASVQFRADDWTATVGVRNLWDETPPWISSGAYNRVGNAPLYSGYDYFGRTAFVNIAKRF